MALFWALLLAAFFVRNLFATIPANVWTNYYLIGSDYAILHEPETEAEIVEAVIDVVTRGTTLKVVGAGHSSNINRPDAGDLMSLRRMNRLLSVTSNTATFEAGITMGEAGEALVEHGLSLEMIPILNESTLGGVASVSATGAGPTMAGFSSRIVEMRLVIADGTVLTVSKNENSDIFKAAQVGIGYMGIISTITMEVVPDNLVKKTTTYVDFDELPSLVDGFRANTRSYIVWYAPEDPKAIVVSITPTNEPITPAGGCHAAASGESCVDHIYLAFTVPELHRLRGYYAYTDEEIHFAAELSSAFAEAYRQLEASFLERFPKATLLAFYRWQDGDDMWMSCASGGPVAKVHISLLTNFVEERLEFNLVWRDLAKKYNARMHWAKDTTLGVEETKALFPNFHKFAEQRLIVDPTGIFLNDQGRAFFGDYESRPTTRPVSPTPSVAPDSCSEYEEGLVTGDPLEIVDASSRGQCCGVCLGNQECVVWNYNSGSGMCLHFASIDSSRISSHGGWEHGMNANRMSSAVAQDLGAGPVSDVLNSEAQRITL